MKVKMWGWGGRNTSCSVRGMATTFGTGVKRRLKAVMASDQPTELERRIGTSASLRQSVRGER